LFALYLGVIMRYRALDIGLIFLRGSWVQLLLFPVVGALVSRMDPRRLLFVSFGGIFLSLWMNGHLTPFADTRALVWPVFVRALGTGFGFVPLTFLAVQSLPESKRPAGTALFNVTRELGASVGTAAMSTLLDRRTKEFFTSITSHVDVYSPVTQEQLAAMREGPGSHLVSPDAGSLALLQARITTQALLRSFNEAFLTLAFAVGVGTLLIFLIRRPKVGAPVAVGDAH
jgi:MFS transporter, DHA2 family, multidrug resistance protein